MADFTITATSLEVVSTSDVQGLKLTSAACTYELPTVNPSGATSGAPQAPAAESDNGVTVWHTVSGGGTGSSGFNRKTVVVANTPSVGAVSIGTLLSGVTTVGPITATIIMIGGGGGGSYITNPANNTTTAGGGGGAVAIKVLNDLSPEQTFILSRGAGGGGGTAVRGYGTPGGDTLFSFNGATYGACGGGGAGLSTADATSIFQCSGGVGGLPDTPSGANTAADRSYWGQRGQSGVSNETILQTGAGGGTLFSGVTIADCFFAGISVISEDGNDGIDRGCGGSGMYCPATNPATGNRGGNGQTGTIIIEFLYTEV